MNLNKWSSGRKILVILVVILLIAGIAGTIFIVQNRQETRTGIEKSTTLSLTPPNQNVVPGGAASLDLNIDPGANQINLVKITLKFDPDRFSMTESDFRLDSASGLEVINGPVVGAGSFSVVLSTGNDPSKVIKSAQKIGSINLSVSNTAEEGTSDVQFEYAQTEVRSIGVADTEQNVLSSATPATINIEAVCKPNIASCSWDLMGEDLTYNYVITDVTDDLIISEGTTKDNFIEFVSEAGKTYKCDVSAENSCGGLGEAGETTEVCEVPTGTPTPSPTLEPIPTETTAPALETSVTITPTVTLTPTPTLTSTPTITLTPTNTPTPTNLPTPTPTTFIPTPTTDESLNESAGFEASSAAPIETPLEMSPTPSLPPTGTPMVWGGLLGGVLIILGGLLLLFL